MHRSIAFLSFLAFSAALYIKPDEIVQHPMQGLNVYELIEYRGYEHEKHVVTTEDGYILEIQRIPRSKTGGTPTKGPILLMHGLLSCAADWVNHDIDGHALAFLLSEAGFDVWLGNARGNSLSRNHIKLSPDADGKKFWDFSWHEIGIYDLPAIIDYILEVTDSSQLQYVGHSQGSTVFAVMGAEKPEYLSKIKLMTALAPAVYMEHLKNPILKPVLSMEKILGNYFDNQKIYELFRNDGTLTGIAKELCSEGRPTQELCRDFIFLIVGFSPEQTDKNFLPVMGTNTPAGIASKQLLHFSQVCNSGQFKQFDYHDPKKNKKKYGTEEPPLYNVANINVPMAIYYSSNDWLVADQDVVTLAGDLPNVVHLKLVDDEYFNHLDFIWATDVKKLLYDEVMQHILNY